MWKCDKFGKKWERKWEFMQTTPFHLWQHQWEHFCCGNERKWGKWIKIYIEERQLNYSNDTHVHSCSSVRRSKAHFLSDHIWYEKCDIQLFIIYEVKKTQNNSDSFIISSKRTLQNNIWSCCVEFYDAISSSIVIIITFVVVD